MKFFSTLFGSERPFGQVRLLRQIFGLEEVEESHDDDEEGNGGGQVLERNDR